MSAKSFVFIRRNGGRRRHYQVVDLLADVDSFPAVLTVQQGRWNLFRDRRAASLRDIRLAAPSSWGFTSPVVFTMPRVEIAVLLPNREFRRKGL